MSNPQHRFGLSLVVNHACNLHPAAKRIVGLPGERISLKDNRFYANGNELPCPPKLTALKYHALGNLQGGREVDCGQGYFVLGDDSQDSYDSRYLGPVAPAQLRGRVWCIVWPPSRCGFVQGPRTRGSATDTAREQEILK